MKSHFINTCSLSYECPLAWDDLEGKDKIRHCHECKKDVYWCDSDADFKRFAANNNCVAFLLSNYKEPLIGVPVYKETLFTRLKRVVEYYLMK